MKILIALALFAIIALVVYWQLPDPEEEYDKWMDKNT
jgi:hypothetical protein